MLRFLLPLITPTWPALLLSTICSLAAIAANVGLMTTSAYLLSMAALHPPIAALSTAIVGVRFFGISRAFARYLERVACHDAALRLLTNLRVWFYRCLEPQVPGGLERLSSADLFTRMVADVETLKFLPVRILLPVFTAVLVLFLLTLLLLMLKPLLALWVFSGLLVMAILLPWFLHRNDAAVRSDLSSARAGFQATVLDSIRGLRDLSAFDAAEKMQGRFQLSHAAYLAAHRQVREKEALGEAGGHLVTSFVFIGALAFLVVLVREGSVAGIFLAAWALLIQSSFEAFFPLPLLRRYREEIGDSARRLLQATAPLPSGSPVGTSIPVAPFHLTMQATDFSYACSHSHSLQNISLDLPQGKKLAIVGPSGAGKSTVLALLSRLQTAGCGSILLNGNAIGDYLPKALDDVLGVVLQDDHVFHATIADNLRLARPSASDRDLWTALDQALLGDVIRNLPDALESTVGEYGHSLSGGERRRLSLARALLKDPPILLLDEPTAGLDPALTHQLLSPDSALLRPGRTVLLVTHQLTGLETMDEILVLDHGQLVERGSWDELLSMQGTFFRFWELQQDAFRNY